MSGFFIIYMIAVLAISCIYRSIWGFAVNKVIENKGYSENWFWWGFFGGLIALIVALTKPDCNRYSYSGKEESFYHASPHNQDQAQAMSGEGWICSRCGKENGTYMAICSCGNSRPSRQYDRQHAQSIIDVGGWRCSCGKINASYIGTCSCGAVKSTQQSVKIVMDTTSNWLCTQCGRDNAPYIGTCACGMSKSAALEERKRREESEPKKNT